MTLAPRIRVQRRPIHGVLLLDKPKGLSSNDALQKTKWLLRAEKAGHTGTLDPLATGVLPICFGAATKFSQIHLEAQKSYEATIQLGITTSSGDTEGEVVGRRNVQIEMLSKALLNAACQKFTGPIWQTPPMTSALKKNGTPLYELARQGLTIDREARPVVIHQLTLEAIAPDQLRLTTTCSKGTYIRTLGQDIADFLGCGGHLSALRRTATGHFLLDRTVTLSALENMTEPEREAHLLPVDCLLENFLRVDLEPQEAGRFLTGMRRKTQLPDCPTVQVYAKPNQLLGSAHIKSQELIATRLLSPVDIEQMQHFYCEVMKEKKEKHESSH